MKRISRLAVCAVGALSVGVSTLVGCTSTEVASPAGRVTTYTLELKWPWAATRPDDNPAPSVATIASARSPQVAATPRAPTLAANSGAPASQPNATQEVASTQASAPASEPTNNAVPNPVANRPALARGPNFLPEPLPNGTSVASSEPSRLAFPGRALSSGKPVSHDGETVSQPVAERSLAALPLSKPAFETSSRDLFPTETSTSGKRTLASEFPAPEHPTKSPPAPSLSPETRVRPAEPGFRVVNSKQIKLHFEVKDAGPAGIAGVELWYLHENRDWKMAEAALQKHGPYVLEVDGEGLYGFKLIARNTQGGGEPPPQAGDPPQLWVLVDITKPAVKINSARVSRDAYGPKLEVSWTATDKNLSHRPVTLLCAEQPEGPWLPILVNLESTGSCRTKLPRDIAKRFVLRAEAIDFAGNVGADQTRGFLEAAQTSSPVSILRID